jgi:stringent starvation protein B
MKSKKPYLLRAIHAWIVDNGMTPHVLVDATVEGVCVIQDFVKDGKIVLNIDHDAVDNLVLDDDSISFTAYFGKLNTPEQMYVPMAAVMATLAQKLSSAAKKKILQKVAARRHSTDSHKKTGAESSDKPKKKDTSFLKVVK